MPLESSFLLVATNVIAVLILILLLKPALKGKQTKCKLILSYFIIFLFCMFSFWGTDWFHYLEDYIAYSYFPDNSTSLEQVYIQLIANYTSNYLQFRVVVWGGALLLLFCIVKKLNINRYLATYFFIIVSLIWFSYSRVSLAFAIMMLGASMLVSKNSIITLRGFLIGFTLMVLSMFFHKSSLFGVGVIIVSYVALFYPKQIVKLSLLLFPVLVVLVVGLLSDFMNLTAEEDEMMSQTINKGQRYMTNDQVSKGIGGLIQQFAEWIPRYLMAYACYRFNKENRTAPVNIKLFINILFFIVLFSSVFLFNVGYNVDTIFGRFLRFSIIPLFVVMTYFYQNRIYPKLTKNAIYIATFSTIYTLVYQMYCAI